MIKKAIVMLAAAAVSLCSFGIFGSAYENDIRPYAEVYQLRQTTENIDLGAGEKTDLSVYLPDGINVSEVRAEIADEDILSVDSDLVLTALAVGETQVGLVDIADDETLAEINVSVHNAPTDISLSLKSVTLGVDETCSLVYTFSEDEYSGSVMFTSSDEDVATVDKFSGKVKAHGTGTAVITAETYNGRTDTCVITVKKAPTKVSIGLSSTTLGIGEKCDLNAAVPSGEASKVITYSSSDTAVATVNKYNGVVTAKKAGITIITAETYNGRTDTCVITVKKAPTKVSIGLSSTTLGVGEKCDLNATVPNGEASKVITYTSSNTSVATVNKYNGVVTAKKSGTAVITAKTFNGKTDTCVITVKKAPTKVSIGLSSTTLGVGEKCDLNATVPSGEASKVITYSSSNTAVATVNKYNGVVTAKKSGTATVTAKTFNGRTDTCVITVKKAPTSLRLNSSKTYISVGGKYDLNAVFNTGEASKVVTYSSSDTSVATVNKYNGVVTAKKYGSATITAKTFNGKTASCAVIVPLQKNAATVRASVIKDKAAWSGKTLVSFQKGAKMNKLSTSGNWVKVEYNGTIGYVYNKAFTNKANYSSITVSSLPSVADDWLFDNGTGIKTIFDYASVMYYTTAPKLSIEEMVVRGMKLRNGACYYYASLVYYLLDRAGYEVIIVEGKSSPQSEHWWNMVKTSQGWRHYDATPFNSHQRLYGTTDRQTAQYYTWDRTKYPAAQ